MVEQASPFGLRGGAAPRVIKRDDVDVIDIGDRGAVAVRPLQERVELPVAPVLKRAAYVLVIASVIEGTRQRLTLLNKTAGGVGRKVLTDVLYLSLQGRYGVRS